MKISLIIYVNMESTYNTSQTNSAGRESKKQLNLPNQAGVKITGLHNLAGLAVFVAHVG